MPRTFREFIKSNKLSFSLLEDEAAPAMGSAPPSPSDPKSTTNKHHFDALQRQLGIDDPSFKAALEQGVIDIWKVPDYFSKWGFIVNGPCSAEVQELSAGNYKVKFLLKDKKSMRPKDFFLPYKDGQQPPYYDGPVEDKEETMTAEELQDAMAEPFKSGGAGGGMPPMGGPPGAGAPPMGEAPMGGPPGAPPMGGM